MEMDPGQASKMLGNCLSHQETSNIETNLTSTVRLLVKYTKERRPRAHRFRFCTVKEMSNFYCKGNRYQQTVVASGKTHQSSKWWNRETFTRNRKCRFCKRWRCTQLEIQSTGFRFSTNNIKIKFHHRPHRILKERTTFKKAQLLASQTRKSLIRTLWTSSQASCDRATTNRPLRAWVVSRTSQPSRMKITEEVLSTIPRLIP